jgi:hypothetical protein
MPKCGTDGRAYLTYGVGAESRNSRAYFDDRSKLTSFLRDHHPQHNNILPVTATAEEELSAYLDTQFPRLPIITLPAPRKRAMAHKTGRFWTAGATEGAAKEFLFPTDQQILFLCPEIKDRYLLRKDERFIVRDGGGAITGVQSRCPKCNEPMALTGFTSTKPSCQKIIQKDFGQMILVGGILSCEPCGTIKKGKTQPKTYLTYSPEIFARYPDAVKKLYAPYIAHLETTKTQQTYWSLGACDKVLFESGSNYSKMGDRISNAFDDQLGSARDDYYLFVGTEMKPFPPKPTNMDDALYDVYKNVKWPGFDEEAFKSYFCQSPTAQTINTLWNALYLKINSFLYRDLYSRPPGRLLCGDGTFAIMNKTRDNPEYEELNKAHVKLLNEYGYLVSWAQATGETNTVYKRLLWGARKRALALGGEAMVNEVVGFTTDTCCQGLNDPCEHYSTKIFPGIKQPTKDLWHVIQLLVSQTVGFGHPIHDPFVGGMWNKTLKYVEEQEAEALKHFMTSHEAGKAIKIKAQARDEMYKVKRYKDSIDNFVPPENAETVKAVQEHCKIMKERDLQMAAAARAANKPYKYYFKPEIPGHFMGFERALEEFCKHCLNGCYNDPLPPHEMSYILKKDPPKDKGPPPKGRFRGTQGAELDNKNAHQQVAGTSTNMSGTTLHRRMMIYAFQKNLQIDAKIAHITGKPARSRDWMLREQLQNEFGCHFSEPLFPDEYPIALEGHVEPVGEDYQEFDWSEVDKEIATHIALVNRQRLEKKKGAGFASPPTTPAAAPAAVSVSALSPPGAATSTTTAMPPARLPSPPWQQQQEQLLSPSDCDQSSTTSSPMTPMKRPAVAGTRDNYPAQKTWRRDRTGGMPSGTLENVYVAQRKLTELQRQHLLQANIHVLTKYNHRISGRKLHEEVATKFNTDHFNLQAVDGVGLSGKITADRVKQELDREGGNVIKGSLGLIPSAQLVPLPVPSHHPHPQFRAPPPPHYHSFPPPPNHPHQHCPLPTHQVVYQPTAVETPNIPSLKELKGMSARDLREVCKAHGVAQRGSNDVLVERLSNKFRYTIGKK